MYGITLGSPECPFFYETNGERTENFTLYQTKLVLNGLLDRKTRNNGHGRHLFDVLRRTGFCRHNFAGDTGFFVKKSDIEGRYLIRLFGTYPCDVVERLNRPTQTTHAVQLTQSIRGTRRKLRALGLYQAVRATMPPAIAGQNAKLKLHFKNTDLLCGTAVSLIAYAGQLEKQWVRRRLMRTLSMHAVGVLRLKGGFVFQVDLVRGFRGLLDLSTPVTLRTTDDNRHPAYRRLRNALRSERARVHRDYAKRTNRLAA